MFTLPREDQALLEQLGYKRKLADVDDAILANATFLNQIVANPAIFENGIPEDEEDNEENLDGPHDEGLFGWLSHKPRTFMADPGNGGGPTVGPSSPSHGHTHSHSGHTGHAHSHSHGPHTHSSVNPANHKRKRKPTEFDMDKVRSTLKQLVRDWSEEVGSASLLPRAPISARSYLMMA